MAARKPTFRWTQPLGGERAADIAAASGDESLSGALYLQSLRATPVPRHTLLEVAADAATGPRGPATARAALELKTLRAFRTIFGSARVHDAEVRRTASVSGSQLCALSEIARSTGMSVNALSKRMALHQTTASNRVNGLVERKLIHRVRDGTDQRVVQLHVATEGRRMLERAPGPHAVLLVDALRQLNATQVAQLPRGLEMPGAVMQRTATIAAGETLLGE